MATSSDRVAGIILAAGTSTRLPPAKLLLPFRGKPVLAHVLKGAKNSTLDEVVLVLGHRAKEVNDALADRLDGVKVAVNPDYALGRSTSVRAGVRALSESAHVLFLLGDMPLVSADLVNTLLARFREKQSMLCFPVHNGRRGHPVIFHRELLPELLSLSGDRSGNELIQANWDSALKVGTEDYSSQLDVDSEEDYQQLLSMEKVA